MQQDNHLQVKNEDFIPVALSYLKEGTTVKLPLKGNSMRPFLEDGRDCAILALPHKPVLYEPVLALLPTGQWVLHRIVDINGDAITLQGDGNLQVEHCTACDIKASVVGFFRKGRNKPDYITGRKWRFYSWCWTSLRPIRRYLLAIYCRLT